MGHMRGSKCHCGCAAHRTRSLRPRSVLYYEIISLVRPAGRLSILSTEPDLCSTLPSEGHFHCSACGVIDPLIFVALLEIKLFTDE